MYSYFGDTTLELLLVIPGLCGRRTVAPDPVGGRVPIKLSVQEIPSGQARDQPDRRHNQIEKQRQQRSRDGNSKNEGERHPTDIDEFQSSRNQRAQQHQQATGNEETGEVRFTAPPKPAAQQRKDPANRQSEFAQLALSGSEALDFFPDHGA